MEERYLIHLYTTHNYVDSRDPRTINYKTGLTVRLDPKFSFTQGRLLKTDWYAPDEQGEYTVKILTVENEYFDHPNGLVDYRITTRRWVIEDGLYGSLEKITTKPYDERMANRESVRRRQNIVNGLRDQTTLFGIKDQFLVMYRDLFLDITAYQDEGDRTIIGLVSTYKQGDPAGAWLDIQVPNEQYTLRQAIMGALNYG